MTAGTTRADLVAARTVADTVLFEGYMLYPYRANDPKNRVRWQFGVLVPPAWSARESSERTTLSCECIVEQSPRGATLRVTARFLQVQRRAVLDDEGRQVDHLDAGPAIYLPWDEAVVQEITVAGRLDEPLSHPFSVSGGSESEDLGVGTFVRSRQRLDGRVEIRSQQLPGPYGISRLHLSLTNETQAHISDRPAALASSLIAAHLLVEITDGRFNSCTDPAEWARPAVETCVQEGVFPVLAGPVGDRTLLLAAPIILPDHPAVAPESVAQFCDGTEMDEMLTLRTLTLTDEEKRYVRGSDPRAAELVDQVDALPPELMDRLHGAIRSMTAVPAPPAKADPPDVAPWWDPVEDGAVDPATDLVLIGGTPVGRGSQVRLWPGSTRADAQDMFLTGRTGTVQAVVFDVDGRTHLAVTLDDLDDLAGGGYYEHGRFLYFTPDEVEAVEGNPCAP